MARVEASWTFPRYAPYSILNTVTPLVAWVDPINHPLVREFRVQLLNVDEGVYRDIGRTQLTYIQIPSDDYDLQSSYKIRIATVATDGSESPFVEGNAFVASPLRFDFSSDPLVKLPDGRSLQTQRLLFLLF